MVAWDDFMQQDDGVGLGGILTEAERLEVISAVEASIIAEAGEALDEVDLPDPGDEAADTARGHVSEAIARIKAKRLQELGAA